jgi:hypothetical protein
MAADVVTEIGWVSISFALGDGDVLQRALPSDDTREACSGEGSDDEKGEDCESKSSRGGRVAPSFASTSRGWRRVCLQSLLCVGHDSDPVFCIGAGARIPLKQMSVNRFAAELF